ncbi:hypothetical protein L195_g029958 [Trifolium pratense]|uniref:Uncharacterized protein n=1 Tax=Trifolium pratense TaxID=57577 RepID=A0A2K3L690_TRIPR|nr:hypothetical protein L195_g029958 [Trifolium pratense]
MARTKNTGRLPAPVPPPTTRDESSLPLAPPSYPNSETISETFKTAPNSDTEITKKESGSNSPANIGSPEKLIAETIMKLSQIETSRSSPQYSNPNPKPTSFYTKSKSKSTNTPQVRRSARLQSGKSSSSEEEGAEKNTDEDGRKGKSPEIEEPTLTQMLPKNMVIPLIRYTKREDFDLYWNMKPVPSCRYYDFANLASGGIDVMKLTEKQEVKLTLEILGKYLNLPVDGAKLFGDTWYSKFEVKKEDLIQEMFNSEGAKMSQPPASFLKTEYKVLFNMVQNHIFPRIGTRDKVYDGDLMVMHHLGSGKKLNLPYVIIHNMIEAASSRSKKVTLPYGMNLTKNPEDFAPNVDNPTTAGPSTRPKKTKMEKEVSKIKRETAKFLEAMMQQNNLIMHIMLEQQIIANGFVTMFALFFIFLIIQPILLHTFLSSLNQGMIHPLMHPAPLVSLISVFPHLFVMTKGGEKKKKVCLKRMLGF